MPILDEAWQILLDAVSNPGIRLGHTNEPVTSRLCEADRWIEAKAP